MSIKIIIDHSSNAAKTGPHLWPPREENGRKGKPRSSLWELWSLGLRLRWCVHLPQITYFTFIFMYLFVFSGSVVFLSLAFGERGPGIMMSLTVFQFLKDLNYCALGSLQPGKTLLKDTLRGDISSTT